MLPGYIVKIKWLKSKDLNPNYLWHRCLGHIGENRISKVHKDGLLDSFDLESFEICKSCLKGKITKAPFTEKGR